MHRPWAALLVAVTVAAACLSSPPVARAAYISLPVDVAPAVGSPVGTSPYGDSDQYTTKVNPQPPAATHSAISPITSTGGGTGQGAQRGGGARGIGLSEGLRRILWILTRTILLGCVER